ncbi:hypothetical protein GGI42DRAFT_329314 [Trichoderma sp. SZMC 28013]
MQCLILGDHLLAACFLGYAVHTTSHHALGPSFSLKGGYEMKTDCQSTFQTVSNLPRCLCVKAESHSGGQSIGSLSRLSLLNSLSRSQTDHSL